MEIFRIVAEQVVLCRAVFAQDCTAKRDSSIPGGGCALGVEPVYPIKLPPTILGWVAHSMAIPSVIKTSLGMSSVFHRTT